MLFKRGNAARDAVCLGQSRKDVTTSWLTRMGASWLAVLSGLTIAFTNAQAANVQQWAKAKPYFHTMLSQPSDLVYHESIEAAFAYAKSIFENCNNTVSPPICKTFTNLRPWSPGPGDVKYNGVAAYWMTSTVTCQGQSCTTSSGGLLFEQFVRCSEGTKPTYHVMQTNSDPYDRQIACVAFVPDIQPCDECDSKGNPIVPSGAEKVQTEIDYVAASGGLRFVRTYRTSTGFFSSYATASLLDNRVRNAPARGCQPASFIYSGQTYSYCNQFLSNGTQTYQARFADGRFAWFGGTPGAFTAKGDIKEKLSQRTDPAGAVEWVLQRTDDSIEIYDAQGALIRRTSRDGREDISFTYSSGNLTQMTDRFGRALAFTYDAAGRMETMTDPAGGLYQYAYDTFNNLASVTYPDNTVRQYHYNEVGNVCSGSTARNLLTGVSENGQRVSTFKYDCSGVPISTERAGGVDKYSFSYGGTPGAWVNATEVDPLGTSRTHVFNQVLSYTVRRSTSQPVASGSGTVSDSLNYDTNGNLSWRKDYNGNRTNFSYDLARNLETQRKEGLTDAGANTPQTRTINTQWHPSFRLATKVAEPLRITTYVYNGDAGASCGSRADGAVVPGVVCSKTIQATTDANGSLGFAASLTGTPRTWSYTYNANGMVLTVDGPRTDVSDVTTYTYHADNDADFGKRGNVATITNALGHRVDIMDYNPHGQATRVVDANGMVTTLTYDARQRLTSRNVGGETTGYDYDPVGQLERVTLPGGSYLNYGYDAARRLTEISDNLGNRIVYTLDNIGNRTAEEVRDPANVLAQKRTRVYNALNRLFKDLGAQNQTTEYGYDNQGNVTSVKDPLTHITGHQYDALNRLKQVTDPGSGVTKYEYNGLDALTKVTDPRNLATNYTINGLGSLTLQSSPDTGNTASTHDAAGNVLTRTDAKGQVTTYGYDALNRVSSATFHDGSKHVYSYDAGTNGIGRLAGITELTPAQTTLAAIVYAYDAMGRVSLDTRTINGVAYATGYRHDSSGRLDRITYPSGRTADYAFDSLGRVSAVTTTPPGGTTSNVATGITYHPFGGVKSYTLGNGQTYARTYDQDGRIDSYTLGAASFSIGYDAASRIGFISEIGNPTNSNNYGYDVLDRLTSANTPGTNYGYGYDAVGNRLSRTVGAGSESYSYSTASNRLATITPSSGPVRSFIFDANGSTTADGISTYVYDVRGRMIQSIGSLGTTNYQANPLGQRTRKTNSSTDVAFHYDAKGNLIAESTVAGTSQKEYVWLGNTPLASISGNNSYFVHPDHLNTPRVVANESGQTVWRWEPQEPFGANAVNENPSGVGAFEFPLRNSGQYADKETGLFYNYFRDYDPSIGRYVESDPVGLLGGLNTYSYVDLNPLTYVDPEGLFKSRVAQGVEALITIVGGLVVNQAAQDAQKGTDANGQSSTKPCPTCDKDFSEYVKCSDLYDYPFWSLHDARQALGGGRLHAPTPAERGPCGLDSRKVLGKHWNVRGTGRGQGSDRGGSIVMCPCCEDRPSGAVLREKYRAIP